MGDEEFLNEIKVFDLRPIPWVSNGIITSEIVNGNLICPPVG